MDVILNKTPKNPIIIEGFPGFGLVGTITTEYLVNHLQMEEIGYMVTDKMQPLVAVHESKLVKPITIYYNKKYNMVIIHSITPGTGEEWDLGNEVLNLAQKMNASQVLSIEGVMGGATAQKVFFHTGSSALAAGLKKAGMEPLKEGIIMGVTAAILARNQQNFASLLAETKSQMPDSRAAAEVIKMLDVYLGLKIDPNPLLKQAELFEAKLKGLIEKSTTMQDQQKKHPNYFG